MSNLFNNTSNNDTAFEKVSTPPEILWDNDNRKFELLDVAGISAGQEFKGYAYLQNLYILPNKNYNQYVDLVYDIVDKNGITFQARQFQIDKRDLDEDLKENSIVLIESGITYPNLKSSTNDLYYNINKIIYNSTCSEIPIKYFLESIEDLTKETKNLVDTVKSLPSDYFDLIKKISNKYDIMTLFKTKPYKNQIGTRLGATVEVLNKTYELLKSLYKNDNSNMKEFLFTIQYLYEANRKIMEIVNRKVLPIEDRQLVNIELLQEIINSNLEREEKQLIINYLHVNPFSSYKYNQSTNPKVTNLIKIIELVERVV